MKSDQIQSADQIQPAALGNVQPAGFPGLPRDWVSEWDTFPSADQRLKLFEAIHHKKMPEHHRALLVVHGLGEHGGRYLHLPHYLNRSVDTVVCFDQRGHGRSEGLRGYCDRFDQFTDDLATEIRRVYDRIQKKDPGAKLHVLGHSFGGLVALRTFFQNSDLPVASLILSSPLLGIQVKVPPIKRMAGNVLAGFWGSLQLSNEIDPTTLSHDPAVGAAYQADRLVHDKITPRFFKEMQSAMEQTVSREDGLAFPLLMLISMDDKIVDAQASQAFFQRLKIRDKKIRTYPGYFHEGMNETGKEKVFEDLNEWISAN